MDATTITIKITSPSSTDGLTLADIKASMTVADLKHLVQDRFPSHPSPNEQRLIFAGHLLNDTDTLQKATSGPACSDKSNATIHLVVRSVNTTTRSKFINTPRTIPTQMHTTHPIQATHTPTIVPLSAPFQYVLYNGQPYLMPLNNLQQQPQQQPPSVLQRFPQFAQAFRQRQLTPAQQRAEVQRRTANLWLALRLFVMVYIFSQGASLERQALFHVLALAIYLWQSGIFAEWARTMEFTLPNRQQAQQAQPQAQPEPEPERQAQEPLQAAAAAAAPVAPQQPPVAPAQGHMRTLSNHPIVRDIEQGFVAFFSSLVPQNPPRIDGGEREAENNNNNNNDRAAAAAEAAGGAAGGGLGGAFL